MVQTEYYQKMIPEYFISAVGEFQNGFLQLNFGLHASGPFINLAGHRAAAPGANVLFYMTYRKFFYMWYSFHKIYGLKYFRASIC